MTFSGSLMMLKKFLICPFLFFVFVCIAACTDKETTPEPPVLAKKIVVSPKTFFTSNELKHICNTSIASFTQGSSQQTASDIKSIFDNAGNKEQCADLLADFFETALNKSYERVSLGRRLDENDVDFDVLIVGGGIHGAILSRSLAVANPFYRVLVIDKQTHPANHFHHYGFRLNSPSFPYDANRFLHSPLSILDHADIQAGKPKAFPKARQIWNHLIFNHFASDGLYSFNTTIQDIEKIKGNYLVTLSSNFAPRRPILVKTIVFTSGLGEDVLPPSSNPDWLRAQMDLAKNYAKSDKSKLPVALSYDELFELNDALLKDGRSLFDSIANKSIAVIGPGDSGKVALEFLAGYGPEEAYVLEGVPHYKAPASIDWFGQTLSHFNDFRLPENGTKPRYDYIGFKRIYDGLSFDGATFKFRTNPEKVLFINPVWSKPHIVTQKSKEEFDLVIMASGYVRKMEESFKQNHGFISRAMASGQAASLSYVTAEVPEFNGRIAASVETVAQQLCLDAVCENIFLVGTAVYQHKLTNERLNVQSLTKNAASIEILGPLTEAFAQFLLSR